MRPHVHVHDEVQEHKQDVAMAEEHKEFAFPSAVRGFHVYRRVWVPSVGQCLSGEQQDRNTEDRFAVAVVQCILASPRQMSRLTPGSSSSWSRIAPSFIGSNTVEHSTWIINLLSI